MRTGADVERYEGLRAVRHENCVCGTTCKSTIKREKKALLYSKNGGIANPTEITRERFTFKGEESD